ncbi:MAG: urate hydroxylase PuuD [Acidobacteria bacterium]|nr:urate hydroxylase PuuD [Acidobacteriota bacterium]
MSNFDLPLLLIQAAQESKSTLFHLPDHPQPYVQILLMWLHFLAGITWIGMLYFFNLVNVNLMKVLDGPTKGKVIPQLMPRVLWWFRWGAVITVLVGLTYYAMYMLSPNVRDANEGLAKLGSSSHANTWMILLVWLVILVLAFTIGFFVVRKVDNGWTVAAIMGVVFTLMAIAIVKWLDSSLSFHVNGHFVSYASNNRVFSIGIGGALGIIMLLNVWGVIWPNQKRIIAWTYNNAEQGTAIPAESAKLARQAFLASRMNFWLSIPMLFLMAASQYFPAFGR